jgi:predicted ABC-type ATPase
MPNLYVIGGANGAGKTTTAMLLLPDVLGCIEYVNADAIAAGLSPFNPESVAIQAGRLMIERLHGLASSGVDFAFETTLASRRFAPFIIECSNAGYAVSLLYFWLHTPDLAVERVARRVASGGHSIPEPVIRRRYEVGRRNLSELYLPIVDNWIVYDNSGESPQVVAEGDRSGTTVSDEQTWEIINS